MSTVSPYAKYMDIRFRIYHFVGPTLMALGTIGAVLSIGVFFKKKMRQNPCAIYFIAFNIANLLFLWIGFFPSYLYFAYGINVDSIYVEICRLRFYLTLVSGLLSSFYLVLASIDRFFITSHKVRMRQRSNRRWARRAIAGVTIFTLVFHVHVFSRVNMQTSPLGFSRCYYDAGIYSLFISYYSITFSGLAPPLLLIIFGFLTLRNIRSARVNTVIVRSSFLQSKDRQFVSMLLSEMAIYVLFSAIPPSFLVYTATTSSQIKTLEQLALETFIGVLSVVLSYVPISMSFYCNIIVSKTFRQHLFEIINSLIKFIYCQNLNNLRVSIVHPLA